MNGTQIQQELGKDDLAQIYRSINPGQVYYGDEPEQWARNILLREIRVVLARQRLAAKQ